MAKTAPNPMLLALYPMVKAWGMTKKDPPELVRRVSYYTCG